MSPPLHYHAPSAYPPQSTGPDHLSRHGQQFPPGTPIDPSLLPPRHSQPPYYQHPSPFPPSHFYPSHYPHPAPPPVAFPRPSSPIVVEKKSRQQAKKRKGTIANAADTSESSITSTPTPVGSAAKRGRPTKASKAVESKEKDTYPSIMVYPPPPPAPGSKYNPSPLLSHQSHDPSRSNDSVSLPSMESWAPPPPSRVFEGHQPPYSSPPNGWNAVSSAPPSQWNPPPPAMIHSHRSSPEQTTSKRMREKDVQPVRSLSDSEEVEAGLALAGLKTSRDSPPDLKKVKKEPELKAATKKNDKDGKKSCAECRRLKAKCDRVFPCSNCRRRGCALVCPDGDLSCMQGKRLVLASTEQLHERIGQLESALFKAHSAVSSDGHPLLAPEYLDGGFASMPAPPPLQQSPPSISPNSATRPELTRSPKDRSSTSSFVLATPQMSAERSSSQGRMAVESLLLTEESAAPEGKREDEWAGENAAPAMIIGTVGNQPSDDLDERHQVFERLKKIVRILPPREETARLAEHFWQTSLWFQTVLRREEFESIYEPAVYAPTPANPLSPHKLAVVLMVLTLETYLDITKQDVENSTVAEYWDGVQRCLDTRFGWSASVAGVQALALATLFVGFGWRGARASNFYWLRQMSSAAMQLGLHKDPHPSLPEEEREFRRHVFREIFVLDCLLCINHGQRTAIPIEYIETAYPKNATPLSIKKYEFCRLVKSPVIDIGCLPDSQPANWKKVQEVKEQLMKFDASAIPEVHCPLLRGEPLPSPVEGFTREDALALQTTTTSMCHYKAMLYLFRPSLRRLVARLRAQPRESVTLSDEDRETVSMTYRACHAITLTSYYMTRKHPRLMARCWMVWVQTFSAAVSMAALAIWCGPHLEASFVNSAYQELCEACDMIGENGSKRSLGVLSLLPILKALVSNRYPHVIGKTAVESHVSLEGEDMLFALLGGQVDGSTQARNQAPTPAQPQIHGQSHVQPQIQQQSQPDLTVTVQDQTQFHIPSQGALAFQAAMINPNGAAESFATSAYSQPYQGWYFDPTAGPLAAGTAGSGGEAVILPLAPSVPTAMPFNSGDLIASTSTTGSTPDQNPISQINNVVTGLDIVDNPTELWARLQTFYEPTPVFWQSDTGVMANVAGGFVDYSGPMF